VHHFPPTTDETDSSETKRKCRRGHRNIQQNQPEDPEHNPIPLLRSKYGYTDLSHSPRPPRSGHARQPPTTSQLVNAIHSFIDSFIKTRKHSYMKTIESYHEARVFMVLQKSVQCFHICRSLRGDRLKHPFQPRVDNLSSCRILRLELLRPCHLSMKTFGTFLVFGQLFLSQRTSVWINAKTLLHLDVLLPLAQCMK
jgi:hypothetical protein